MAVAPSNEFNNSSSPSELSFSKDQSDIIAARNEKMKSRLLENAGTNLSQELTDIEDLIKTIQEQKLKNENKPEFKINNLEYDLRSTEWILDKVRKNRSYAQNLYAALCNQDWQKLDVLTILKDEYWSCSWRYAGGIIADMVGKGDYLDWYCSGIRNVDYDEEQNSKWDTKSYVSEGHVTEEIENDLRKLGWQLFNEGDDE